MTSAWDDPALTGSLGDRIADDLRGMVRAYENSRDRTQQTDIGPSALGKPCTRCLARHVLGMSLTRDFDDPWARIIGTFVHEGLECVAHTHNTAVDRARYLTETRVQPHPDVLPKGGNADLYDADTATVIDHKVVGPEPLRKYRLNGPGQQYRIQGHLYGLGFHRLGKPVEHVAIAFWPRGGRLSDLYVWTEPFDAQIALDAIDRYRTIRDQALAIGPAILPHLPAHESCWDCGGKDVSAEELAVITNPTQTIPA